MKLSGRTKLVLIAVGFALPIVASVAAYYFVHAQPTANYGELLLPPAPVSAQDFERPGAGPWRFTQVRGRWALVVSDSGSCASPCIEKLTTMRQVHLALGRNASRVMRIYVVDDIARLEPDRLQAFEGTLVVVTPKGMVLPPGPASDRAHIDLVDPNGNVMMRWPAAADRRRMLKDLERLLKASQIG